MSTGTPHSRGKARILKQKTVARGYREIQLSVLEAAGGPSPAEALPGQFFTILPENYPMSMMRRPFAYSDVDADGFSFIYEIRGRNTHDLAELEDGSILDWIGPLGSAFPLPEAGSKPVLVAGGIGVGPILFLAREIAAAGIDSTVVLGARSAALVPDLAWPSGVDVRVCTDDGSLGIHGTALDGLAGLDLSVSEFFTCGPHPMMAAVHRLAVSAGRDCRVSMEEMMACGVGACQGCAVPVLDEKNGDDLSRPSYKRACLEGPIFNSREISW